MAKVSTTETVIIKEPTPLEQLTYFIISLVEVVLLFRFVLQLFGATANIGFVAFIYNISAPLVAPFFGIFSADFSYGSGQFEIVTVVAMVAYLILGYIITALISVATTRRA